MLEHITTNNSHTGIDTSLEHITSSLEGNLQAFILSCRVDGLSPRTIEYYQDKVSRFVKSVDVIDPLKVTTHHVRLFLLELKETNNPVSIYDFYRALKRFFNWLVAEEMLVKSPMQSMRPPRVPHKIMQPFSHSEINAMLEVAGSTKFLSLRNKALMLVFLDTGLRLAEIASICKIDVNIDKETIKVLGKGARERIVRICPTTQKAIIQYVLSRKDNHAELWVTEERIPMTRRGVQITIRKIAERAGIKGKTGPHRFRHTFATNALLNGANIFYIQALLGHNTLDMTRRYASSIDSAKAVEAHKSFSPVDNMGLR